LDNVVSLAYAAQPGSDTTHLLDVRFYRSVEAFNVLGHDIETSGITFGRIGDHCDHIV